MGAGASGATLGATTSAAAIETTSLSRCGLPHLWQKRASGGRAAPQLQNSCMIEREGKPLRSVCRRLSYRSKRDVGAAVAVRNGDEALIAVLRILHAEAGTTRFAHDPVGKAL